MKIRSKWLLLLTVLFFQSCLPPCGECFSPPAHFVFELIDKESGENLFTNGTFNSADLEILNLADNTTVEFNFIDENNFNVIEINDIGWTTEIVNYSFNILTKHICNLYVDAERTSDRCCSYTVYNEIEITDAEFNYDNSSGIYQIIVE